MKSALQANKPFKLHFVVRLPFIRTFAARLIGFSVRRVRLRIRLKSKD